MPRAFTGLAAAAAIVYASLNPLYAQDQKLKDPAEQAETLPCPENRKKSPDWLGRPRPYNLWPQEALPPECRQKQQKASKEEEKRSIFQTKIYIDAGWVGWNSAYGRPALSPAGVHFTVAEAGRLNFGAGGLNLGLMPYYSTGGQESGIKTRPSPMIPLLNMSYELGYWDFVDSRAYFTFSGMKELGQKPDVADSKGKKLDLYVGLSFQLNSRQ
jgi:hypothetical protein